MNEIVSLTKELKKEINSLPLFIEYFDVKKLYNSNTELLDLKRKIFQAKSIGDISLYNELINEFNSNPLVINYLTLKEEALSFIRQVTNIIKE